MHRLPTFIGIGAQKSGTTSLYKYLSQHPDIYFSPLKNLKFFCTDWSQQPAEITNHNYRFVDFVNRQPYHNRQVAEWDEYVRFFDQWRQQSVGGELCPGYLALEESPELIARRLPNIKLVAILRNPIDRLVSHFNFHHQMGIESLTSVVEAAESEEHGTPLRFNVTFRRDGPARSYVRNGLYGLAVSRYLKHFDADQLLICKYEDLQANPTRLCQTICKFLGIDDEENIDTRVRHNPTRIPRHDLARRILVQQSRLSRQAGFLPRWIKRPLRHGTSSIRRMISVRPAPIDLKTRMALAEFFREDISRLSDVVGEDFNYWISDD